MSATTTATTSLAPTGRRLWTRSRGLLAGLLVLVLGGVGLALLRSGDQHGRLDPRSVDRYGSGAVATLLADRGVDTRVVTTTDEAAAAAGPDTTVLVADPDLLTRGQLGTLHQATGRAAGRTVLLSPSSPALDVFAPGTEAGAPAEVRPLDPNCALPAARSAGDAELGGLRYSTSATGADRCYPSSGKATLLRLPTEAGGDTVLLGAPDILYNHRLAERGNASLALQLLGSHKHLVWYLPSVSDPSSTQDGRRSFFDLIPAGWNWALLQLLIAAALAGVWRARRLGPLVPERLPVTVPAAETTEGHARLYEQTGARDRAAAVLRAAARTRLAPLTGVSPTHAHTPDILLPAVAARLPADAASGTALHSLLFGPPPADDKALVTLADQLDNLEHSILSPERHDPREHPDS
ncbi:MULTISPECIES: DUF4350 domain-containing protein [Streptomyces]|uniref:DUF4350 domain-containing protein n=2 Tax=Streptomyces rimosus subsp. rimosus TaxID=132474 RepID=L8ES41_STRR1|nr:MULTISPECIES: DUF4350 domain-containing protein [Streptomyces]KOG79905.1 hypothetical protein ADK78_05910 [Kitasatospora aureofaciens]MYT42668.1 DUF4350 domain-containing protein [Streptomyces sp. SID5471]KEF03792.1 hypothetical protein DF17_26475 [Streptomyces rimosus]KOT43302.1 hypothetical protein ADK42_08115 [Streptomyces rimosus subsp. rimosus]KOT44281.1 hypothetical protein ADK84_07085 [Streptomyces sp. NRRL WC-3701]